MACHCTVVSSHTTTQRIVSPPPQSSPVVLMLELVEVMEEVEEVEVMSVVVVEPQDCLTGLAALLPPPVRPMPGCDWLPPPSSSPPPLSSTVTDGAAGCGRPGPVSRPGPRTESRDTELSQHSRGEYILQLS